MKNMDLACFTSSSMWLKMSELAKALLAFQLDAPKLHKAAEGQIGSRRYKYTTLDELIAKVRPALNAQGLVLTQGLAFDSQVGLRTLDTTIIHAESGEKMQSWLVLPPTDDMQEFGKALTYGRRQSLEAMLGVVGEEDTDGAHKPAEEPAEPFPPSIPETLPPMAKPGQIAEMRDLLAELEMQENRRDPTWATMARQFAEDQLGIKAHEKPNMPQMETILGYMRGFLKVPS